MRRAFGRVAPGVLALALAGCSLAPKYVREAPPVPPSWPVGDAYLAQSEAALPVVSYRQIFTDPRLQALVEQALVNNRDLRVAAANLAAARAQVQVQRGEQFPQVGISAGVTRTANGSVSGSGSAGSGSASGSGGSSATGTNTTFDISGGVSSFELDLFGRLASLTAAQRQTALATEAAARTVRLGLVADLANAWATYAADAELLGIAQRTAESAERSVRLTRARLDGGVAPRTDLRAAEQVQATALADLAVQKTALAQDRNLIDLLVGAPADPALLPADLAQVSAGIAPLPAGTRSDVLLRRPDVIEAEYRLRAANADIGAARAALFPRISLTGLLGLASNALGELFSGGLRSTLSAGASYSIFSGGAARANVRVSEAQRDAALGTYEKTIQTAFREVADALARQGTLADQVAAVTLRTNATADSARLTEARYRGGVASALENLDAQRSLYTAQQQDVAARLTVVQNRVTLYRVLGGDQASPPAG